MLQMSRRQLCTVVSAVTLSAVFAAAQPMSSPVHAKTLTAVMHSDLRILDPGFTGAYITRDHG